MLHGFFGSTWLKLSSKAGIAENKSMVANSASRIRVEILLWMRRKCEASVAMAAVGAGFPLGKVVFLVSIETT